MLRMDIGLSVGIVEVSGGDLGKKLRARAPASPGIRGQRRSREPHGMKCASLLAGAYTLQKAGSLLREAFQV